MIRISYMVHGTTIENERDVAAGWAPGTLSPRGLAGCQELAPRLRALGLDVIHVSDTARAVESARLFFGEDRELFIDPRLRELNYGQRTGGPRREVEALMQEGPEFRFPGGECLFDVEARVRSLVATLERRWPGKHVGIVAHRATQNALEVLLGGKTWAQALASDWRHTKDFKGVWSYEIPDWTPPRDDDHIPAEGDPVIREEVPADWAAIRRVNDRAFGQPQEGRLVDEIRGRPGFDPGLSLVATMGPRVVGHILFSPLIVVTRSGPVSAMGLAPMAVDPAFQRRGIGGMLVRHGLVACRERNHNRVVVLGHSTYYPRFGFVPASHFGVTAPFPVDDAHFMAIELVPRVWQGAAGRVVYPDPFLT